MCESPATKDLGELAFPVAQILIGIMAATPSVYFVPLKFHILTCLHQLAASCQLFIPTSAKLFEILQQADLDSKVTPSTEVPPRLQFLLKFPVDSIGRAAVRDLIVQEVAALLHHDAELYRYHVGFPEYVCVSIRKLKVFVKKTKVSKWRDLYRSLASQLEESSTFVKRSRKSCGITPSKITDFEPLLPVGCLVAALRLKKLVTNRLPAVEAVDPIVSAPVESETKAKSKKHKSKKPKTNKLTEGDNALSLEDEAVEFCDSDFDD